MNSANFKLEIRHVLFLGMYTDTNFSVFTLS